MICKLGGTARWVFSMGLRSTAATLIPSLVRLVDQFGVNSVQILMYCCADWEIYTAGTVSDRGTRDMFITRLRDYLANGKNNAPFSDW
jgi:hypothetical protein